VIVRCLDSFRWLFACSCMVLAFTQASPAENQPVFAIKVVTSSDDQFWTNSVVLRALMK
jgi:hypothetical protein